MVIDLEYTVGRLDGKLDEWPVLKIMSPSEMVEGDRAFAFQPAQCVGVYGIKALTTLRDALIEYLKEEE